MEPTSRVSSVALGQELWVDLKNSVWCEYVVIVSQKLNSFDLPLSVKHKIKGRAVVLRNRERRKLFCHLGIDTERNQTQFQPNRFYCFHYIEFRKSNGFCPKIKIFRFLRFKSAKYTLLTFLPLNIIEQFRRGANFYFLVRAIILMMMINILWCSVCLCVTKNDHFLKRSVCLFVMFYPHFFKSRK